MQGKRKAYVVAAACVFFGGPSAVLGQPLVAGKLTCLKE